MSARPLAEHERPEVTIVGLGPAGPEFMTEAARSAIASAPLVLVRTERHLAAKALVELGAQALDHHYERAETFEEVYRGIVDEVVAAAIEHGHVVYAVPGSPFVLEDTVGLLIGDERVQTTTVAGMSFLDLCWERLGIDPVKTHVRFVDATSFATDAAFDRGPLLIGQVYSRTIASQVKLAVDQGPTQSVVVLSHLGHEDESVTTIDWADLDRSVVLDHLSCVYVPELQPAVGEELARAIEIVAILRQQCPWDKEQTHGSLGRHLIEETYETIEAIDELEAGDQSDAATHLEEELGDLLCQVLFHATLASEEGLFDLGDVARTLSEKLTHRHPHVFGDVTDVSTADAVVSRWEQIKQEEKGRASLMDGIPAALPALSYVTKVERKMQAVGLGMADEAPLVNATQSSDWDEVLVGELLLSIARRAAAAGLDPEASLRKAAVSLRDQFMAAEQLAVANGSSFAQLSPEERSAIFATVQRS